MTTSRNDWDGASIEFNLDAEPDPARIAADMADFDDLDGLMRVTFAAFYQWADATRLPKQARLDWLYKTARAYMLAAQHIARLEAAGGGS